MADKIDPDVSTWSRDWRRLRHQKHRHQGGVEAGMLFDYLLYEGEHQSTQVQNTILTRAFKHERDKNKLRLVINLARKAVDRKIGRLWSIAHEYTARPNVRDPLAYDKADVLGGQLIPALDYKLGQNTLRWNIFSWLTICGVCFEHCDWKEGITQDVLPKYVDGTQELLWTDSLTQTEIPESQVQFLIQSGHVAPERFQPAKEVQSAGDVGGDIYDPFRVFVDASVTQIKNLGPKQAVYLADIRSRDWIAETFGSQAADSVEYGKRDLSIIETQLIDRGMPVSNVNLKDLLPLVQGSQGKDDPDMAIVLTRYEPPCEDYPDGLRSFFVPDQVVLDKGDMPYPEVPIIDYHWSAPKSTMWTVGFVRDLQSMSKFINKRFSQLGEASNAQLYEMLLIHEDLKPSDIPTDFPGVVKNGLTDEGMAKVQRVERGTLPSFFPESIRLSMETMDSLSSSDLLSQRQMPQQIRGALALPMLQELLDSEDGPRYSHFGEQFSLEKMMRINRVKQFYPPIRTLNYAGDSNRDEVLELHTDDLLRAGVDFTVTADPGTLVPEMSSMREARVRERIQWAPGLYTNPRTGQMDWSKVAKDLKYNDRSSLDSANQARKMARQLVRWVRQGKLSAVPGPPDPQTGAPGWQLQKDDGSPFVVLPFWDHNSMMDEYEDEMTSTEFLEASPPYKQSMFILHDAHRSILASIDAARQNAVNDKMVQGAVAQATQQASAKAASVATDAAMQQVMAQAPALQNPSGTFGNLQAEIRQLLGSSQAAGAAPMPGQPPAQPRMPQIGPMRRQVPA